MRTLEGPLIRFHETSVPDVFTGLPEDFSDAAHMGAANADRLLAYVLRGN